MNLKTIKSPKELTLAGVKIEWIKEDEYVREVRIVDANGRVLVVRSGGSYSDYIRVMTEVPDTDDTKG